MALRRRGRTVPAWLDGALGGATVPVEGVAVVALQIDQDAVPAYLPAGVIGKHLVPPGVFALDALVGGKDVL